ncbi:MAG: hypothetical protein QM692_20910 [Thermomicrobiales bacterium]
MEGISLDTARLDDLARALATGGSRRRVLGAIAAIPVAAGLLSLTGADDADAKDRRRRRKRRHKRRHDAGSRKSGGCQRKPLAKICDGVCGSVANRKSCGKTVDCGTTCPTAGETCCGGLCQSAADLGAACPATGTPGFLTFEESGEMRCASPDVAACQCLGGVYRACAAGATCRPEGAGIVCDSQAPE